jgi:RNA polymerase sigma-54 factor
MALTQRLDLRQSQSLVMTPQLQQAIKLLQLSNLELSAYVEQELERNPLLQAGEEADNGDDSATDKQQPDTGDSQLDGEGDGLGTLDLAAGDGIARREDAPLDTDYDNMWNGAGESASGPPSPSAASDGPGGGRAGRVGDGDRNLEQTLSNQVSLRDHLLAQINVDLGDPVERKIGIYLVDTLDDSGYLGADLDDVAAQLGCDRTILDNTVTKLLRLDPVGIFAHDLAQCLALQLEERNRLDPAMQALLDNLDLLAKRDLAALIVRCGVDEEDLTEMVAEIRMLTPKPAQAFDAAIAQPITPDIFLRRQSSGGWLIELNSETLPRVLVDGQYYARVSEAVRNKDEHKYLADQLQSANWLVKALHQRATTILRVATEIVRQQDAFFERGVQHLRPLVLRDIASELDLHESTVSRVTTNKYMATPRGIFELKYFFTTAIAATGGGDQHSAESVRHRIKRLIDKETLAAVLSDDAIVTILHKEGIDIARRTVAKYREAMRIPSSVQRRREMKSHI